MKKIISIVGTRPNFIKLAGMISGFKKTKIKVEHIIIHTDQHYDQRLSNNIWSELKLPQPKYNLNSNQIDQKNRSSYVISQLSSILKKENPNLVLVYGDVNSTLWAAQATKKCKLLLAHIEAGLRSGDLLMPEERNRIAVDRISDYHFVSEPIGLKYLSKEKIVSKGIYLVGDVMLDPLFKHKTIISQLKTWQKHNLKKNHYIVVTFHRPSNVDKSRQREAILSTIDSIHNKLLPCILPIHPRLKKYLTSKQKKYSFIIPAQSYFNFNSLVLGSRLVITDSGGVQVEPSILGTPSLTFRSTTERPMSIKKGLNQLVNPNPKILYVATRKLINQSKHNTPFFKFYPLFDGQAGVRIASKINLIINKKYASKNYYY